jgi:DNA end-binding protein Ku
MARKRRQQSSSEDDGSETTEGTRRAIWKGAISFGLVNIPVALMPATQRHELSFHQLDPQDKAPIGYKRVNKETGEEVPWNRIVKGYEHKRGEYVVVEEDELRAADVEATQTVEIVGFCDFAEIDPRYFDTPYYLAPVARGDHAYALLRETLRKTRKVGIARVVLHTREHVAALYARGRVLVLDLLRYQHELRDPDAVPAPPEKAAVAERELQMAEKLVEDMVEPWKPEQYKDEYRDRVLELIRHKAETGEVAAAPTTAAPAPSRVVDLMALLKRSVEEHAGPRRAHRKSA